MTRIDGIIKYGIIANTFEYTNQLVSEFHNLRWPAHQDIILCQVWM